ncbi:hypothetical protein J6590_101656, partial [Homalodisca vitripennis]
QGLVYARSWVYSITKSPKEDSKSHQLFGQEIASSHLGPTSENGRVFVFGSNEWGQLGLGHRSVVTKPSCVKILKPEQATHVACGRAHTIISTGSGKVFACGNNSDGQLGVGDTTDKDTPTPVEGVTGPVEQLAAGCHHSVALNSEYL